MKILTIDRQPCLHLSDNLSFGIHVVVSAYGILCHHHCHYEDNNIDNHNHSNWSHKCPNKPVFRGQPAMRICAITIEFLNFIDDNTLGDKICSHSIYHMKSFQSFNFILSD